MNIQTTLPTVAGFYWWRPVASAAWRMIHILNFGSDERPYLNAYDVDLCSFGGRSLRAWAESATFPHPDPVGEWIGPLPKPESTPNSLIH